MSTEFISKQVGHFIEIKSQSRHLRHFSCKYYGGTDLQEQIKWSLDILSSSTIVVNERSRQARLTREKDKSGMTCKMAAMRFYDGVGSFAILLWEVGLKLQGTSRRPGIIM